MNGKRDEGAPSSASALRLVESILLPTATAMLLVGVWHAAVELSRTDVLPSPPAVVRGVSELARKGVLASYVRDSLVRVGAGYSLALVLGIPLGIALGWYPRVAQAITLCPPAA